MPLADTLLAVLSRISRACGFDTVDAFPPGHRYARTRWNRAYFDIASDLKPDAIERAVCDAIANTPSVFAHITHPTPRMQHTLLAVIEERMRRSCGQPLDLAALLVQAYASPHTPEAAPGLRALMDASAHEDMAQRARLLLEHLARAPSPTVIEG